MATENIKAYFEMEMLSASREQLLEHQWRLLRRLLMVTYEHNPFYQAVWQAAGLKDERELMTWEGFHRLPTVTRAELSQAQDAHPPYGTNLTWPLERYTRWFRTSGTKAKSLIILNTREDWEVQNLTWMDLFRTAGLRPGDSAFLPFSFGPFQGFWTAYGGVDELGLLLIPGGGQTTLQRLHSILEFRPSAVICLPSYALRMVEVAQEHGIDLRAAGVRALFHGGEPGPASIPSLRSRVEGSWGASSYDGYGLTETGHMANECSHREGLHVLETVHYIEVLEPGGNRPVPEGEVGELVITSLCRTGMPVIRYRTCDLVRLTTQKCGCGRTTARLMGGVLGRADDMVTVRGVNVYPTALDEVLFSHPEIAEYRVEVYDRKGMKELRVKVEHAEAGPENPRAQVVAEGLAQLLRQRLCLRADIEVVPNGTLPREDGKAKRLVFVRPELEMVPVLD